MYSLQLPFVSPNANSVQISFLIMCWIWHITLENKVTSNGKKEQSGCCAVKKPQQPPSK